MPGAPVYKIGMRTTVQLFAVGAVFIGLGLIWGGPGRFQGRGLAAARLVPGGCYTWGTLITAFGVVALAGIAFGWRRRVVLAGLLGQAFCHLFFAVAVFRAFLHDPLVSTWGWSVALLLAMAHFVLFATGHQLKGIQQ